MSRRLILFRRLGPAERRIARWFVRLGFDVRFLEPVGALRSEATVETLRKEKIVWLKASELPGINAFLPIAAGHELALNIVDRFFPAAVLAKLGSIMPEPANKAATLRILLYELARGYAMPHGLAVTVARLLRAQGYRVYLWQQEAAILKLARADVRNLHPSLLAMIVKLVRRLRDRLVSRPAVGQSATGGAGVASEGAPTASAEVLFFPHHGPYYGDLYEKNQYYAADPASPFHRDRICHVELGEAISPSARAAIAESYSRAGISAHWLPPIGRTRIAVREFLTLALRIGPTAAALGLLMRHRFVASLDQLSVFSSARIAVLGYDTQFPRVTAAALQGRGIHVAAAQDRFVQPFHPGFHLVLNHYLVHGNKSAEVVRVNSLCEVGSVVVTGDLRQPQRCTREDGPHRCLVLDYHSLASPFEDAFAIGSGWASNRLFLKDVLRLSEDFADVHFTVRGKNTLWTELPEFADLVAYASRRPNVTIDRDRSLDRSYNLLAHSDSVVARHTSLGDQALALGVPVLFHERMATGGRSIAEVFDYAPYPLLTRSYDELRARFGAILRDGHVLTDAQNAQMRHEFYAQPANVDSRQVARKLFDELLANASSPLRRAPASAMH